MLSIRVSPKPLSTRVIYQGQSEAALSTSCNYTVGMSGACLSDEGSSRARVANEGSVRS